MLSGENLNVTGLADTRLEGGERLLLSHLAQQRECREGRAAAVAAAAWPKTVGITASRQGVRWMAMVGSR